MPPVEKKPVSFFKNKLATNNRGQIILVYFFDISTYFWFVNTPLKLSIIQGGP